MNVKDFLSPADITDLEAKDKGRLLQELSSRAAASLGLEPGTVLTEILNREALGSTGIGGGAAIPHARIPGLQKPYGLLARLREPIDFDAIDEQPVDIVFFLLLPASAEAEQLNTLACVARKLRDRNALRDARRAVDGASLYRVIAA
jgi:PTS system nitrogen regulatory IIA component